MSLKLKSTVGMARWTVLRRQKHSSRVLRPNWNAVQWTESLWNKHDFSRKSPDVPAQNVIIQMSTSMPKSVQRMHRQETASGANRTGTARKDIILVGAWKSWFCWQKSQHFQLHRTDSTTARIRF